LSFKILNNRFVPRVLVIPSFLTWSFFVKILSPALSF
jgi:hypothetical protein